MYYRFDIDGIRAMAVVVVILFHLGFESLSGGYVGVDIFFVISGYLITSLIYTEIKEGRFSYIGFYRRRVARLLPALIITLFSVLFFGFLFYDNQSFDNLGKEVLFSSLGIANILFGQGVNYFAQDEAVRPLIHLWSLGVEEQFYFIWPTLLIIFLSFRSQKVFSALILTLLLLFLSLYLAINNIEIEPIKTYFYPQYRVFELLIGASTALFIQKSYFYKTDMKLKEFMTLIATVLMIVPMFTLDKNSLFPSFYTLVPTVGTALFIIYADRTLIARFFSLKPIVFIGLISYPLYLYHQPIISYLHFFTITKSPILSLFIVLAISVPLAWLTYRYIERPIRKLAHQKISKKPYISGLIISLMIIAIAGMFIAKNDGLGERFRLLNPFAYEVSQKSATTFHKNFTRGFSVSKDNSKILFIGDSVVQHFIYPFTKSLGIEPNEVDTITRGGCVLLKGIEFRDPYQLSDISCESLNQKLYNLDKKYDYIVISQSWSTYDDAILNSKSSDSIEKWEPFIYQTLNYIKSMAKKVIIIGQHPEINGTSELKPTIFLSKDRYLDNLNNLEIANIEELQTKRLFFEQYRDEKVEIFHPIDIFYKDKRATLHDNSWSFFSDKHHLSIASNKFMIEHLNLE